MFYPPDLYTEDLNGRSRAYKPFSPSNKNPLSLFRIGMLIDCESRESFRTHLHISCLKKLFACIEIMATHMFMHAYENIRVCVYSDHIV